MTTKTVIGIYRAIQIGHFPDNRTPDCDLAGYWVGQIKTESGWQDNTDVYETKEDVMNALMRQEE